MTWSVKSTTLFVSVGISLSLSVSVALLYLLLRKEKDDGLEKSERADVKTSRQAIIYVKVPKNIVGAVIGRGGSKVKEIQQKTNTKINFEDPVEEEDGDRIAIIRGSIEEAQDAENLINQLIADQPEIITEEIFIPVKSCGRIIGRNGDNIRHICQVSRAKVVVDSIGNDKDSTLRRVTLRGSRDQIEMAISMIDENVAEDEVYRQKIELSTACRPVRYQGKLQIEGASLGSENNSEENRMQEKLIPVASDGYLEVYVSAVDTAGHFWVQLVGTKSVQLDKMVEEITDFYRQPVNQDLMRVDKVSVGDIVAAPFLHDDSWYRARVTHIEEDSYCIGESKVKVMYVDFGDTGELEQKHLCSLKPEYMIMPFQAIECELANVSPCGDVWQEEATDLFEQLSHVAHWKVMMAKPILYSTVKADRSVSHVELVDTNGTKDLNVAEELVRKGFAVWDRIKKL